MANQKTSSAKKEDKKTTKAASKPATKTTTTKASTTKTATKKPTSTTKKTEQKSHAPIIAGVGVAVVLVAVVAGLLIWNSNRMNYDGLADNSTKLGEELAKANGDDSCKLVYDDVDEGEISVADYDKAVDTCKSSLDKIESMMHAIENDNVVENDEDIKDSFDTLKGSYDRVIPAKSEYELSLEIYKAVHESMVESKVLDSDEYDDLGPKDAINMVYDVYKKMADRFAKVPDDDAKEFSEKINGQLKKLAEIRDKVSDSMSSSDRLKIGVELQQVMSDIQSEAATSMNNIETKMEKLNLSGLSSLEANQKRFTAVVETKK